MNLPTLPEPNAFTLDDIAEKWGCNTEKLIGYFESEMLKIQVYMSGSTATLIDLSFENDGDTRIKTVLDGLYSVNKDVIIGTWRLGENACEEYSPMFTHVFDGLNTMIELEHRTIIGAGSLRISKKERDRFEAEHNVFKASGNQTKDESSKLDLSTYWNSLKSLTEEAVAQYPAWSDGQRKVQKTSNLTDWLTSDIGANSREAEIIKKVLTDIFNI
jgi:hypothetical protein